MNQEYDKKIQKQKEYLLNAQLEIQEAILSRKGSIGKQYLDIIDRAAAAMAVMHYFEQVEGSGSFAEEMQHISTCLLTIAFSQVMSLSNITTLPLPHSIEFDEMLGDIQALVLKRVGFVHVPNGAL